MLHEMMNTNINYMVAVTKKLYGGSHFQLLYWKASKITNDSYTRPIDVDTPIITY
jgi:hypothetical protein